MTQVDDQVVQALLVWSRQYVLGSIEPVTDLVDLDAVAALATVSR